MDRGYEKRPVIGMVALIWIGLAIMSAVILSDGLLRVLAFAALAVVVVTFRAVEARGGMVVTVPAAHPAFRYACGLAAAGLGAAVFAIAFFGAAYSTAFFAMVFLAAAITAWHFAPGQRSGAAALEVQR